MFLGYDAIIQIQNEKQKSVVELYYSAVLKLYYSDYFRES
jgi:hypothetical protein